MTEGFMEVRVMVPTERIAEFYDVLSRFLRQEPSPGQAQQLTSAGPTEHSASGRPHGLTAPQNFAALGRPDVTFPQQVSVPSPQPVTEKDWLVNDPKRRYLQARHYWFQIHGNSRALLRYLLAQENFEAPATAIMKHLGLDSSKALAGTMSAFGAARRNTGLPQPFLARTDPDVGTVYYMFPEIAEVLLEGERPQFDESLNGKMATEE